MKIIDRTMFINIEIPVEILSLKVKAVVQLIVFNRGNGKETETDFVDIDEPTHLGVKIDNWKDYKDFHKKMGINLNELIENEFSKSLTKEVIDGLIKDINL
jgi:hypothetical protein